MNVLVVLGRKVSSNSVAWVAVQMDIIRIIIFVNKKNKRHVHLVWY
jgi:hypothetical protein